MCACTDIFAKSSITQRRARGVGHSPKACEARPSVYYIITQICVFARGNIKTAERHPNGCRSQCIGGANPKLCYNIA